MKLFAAIGSILSSIVTVTNEAATGLVPVARSIGQYGTALENTGKYANSIAEGMVEEQAHERSKAKALQATELAKLIALQKAAESKATKKK